MDAKGDPIAECANQRTRIPYHRSLSRLERIEEARAAAREVLRIRPEFSLKVTQGLASVDPNLMDAYIEDLRKAGVPE